MRYVQEGGDPRVGDQAAAFCVSAPGCAKTSARNGSRRQRRCRCRWRGLPLPGKLGYQCIKHCLQRTADFLRHRQGVQYPPLDQPAEMARYARGKSTVANEKSYLNIAIKGSLREVGRGRSSAPNEGGRGDSERPDRMAGTGQGSGVEAWPDRTVTASPGLRATLQICCVRLRRSRASHVLRALHAKAKGLGSTEAVERLKRLSDPQFGPHSRYKEPVRPAHWKEG